MNIAYLTPEYPHPKTGTIGGIATSIKNLALALTKLGHKVIILVYNQNIDAIIIGDGIEIHQIKNVKFKGLSWFLTRKKLERKINSLYSENKIEIVEAPDWTGITAFIKPKKCPILVKLHGSDTYFCKLDNRKVKPHTSFFEKSALKNADALVSVSQFTADYTNQVFGLNLNFKIIPNGINTELFVNQNKTKSLPKKIIYFGSLIRKKGLLELPLIFNEVIEKFPNATLQLIGRDIFDAKTGNSSTWSMMQSLFSAKALKNVAYLGIKPYSEIKNYIENASVCVFPSFAEALPVSWIEAMALEIPVVASNIGWASEIIDDGVDGFLVDPKNHKLFAEKICYLLENENFRDILAQKARQKIINKFDNQLIAEQNLEIYKKVVY